MSAMRAVSKNWMTDIVPAILAKNLKEIEAKLSLIRGACRQVQIDAVDGVFARTRSWWGTSWPYRDHKSYDYLLANDRGLPFWDEFDFEFDMMVNEPAARAAEAARAMASHVVIHATAPGALHALRALADFKDKDDGSFSVTTGVALLPSAQPEELEAFDGLYDYVQVMGIARVGRQGEPFDPRARNLVERLRARNPALVIQVDGAVTMANARALSMAGANKLVVGHAAWQAKDPKAAIAALLAEANKR
jgi:pentose-5-phosphate-3-epimerase